MPTKEVKPMAKKKTKKKDYLVVKQQLKHLTTDQYQALRELTRASKNLYNYCLYQVRQHFFSTGNYLSYESNYHVCKLNENYKLLNSNVAQQTLKDVDGSMKSFFALMKLVKEGSYDKKKVRLPKYLDKDGFYPVLVGFVRLNEQEGSFTVPYSNLFKKSFPLIKVQIPKCLQDKRIKQIKIVPFYNAQYFELQYAYEVPQETVQPLDRKHALSIDLGVGNLLTCTTSKGKSFIIDGKQLKALNQWYNKRNSYLQSIKDKQGIKGLTKQQARLTRKRNNQVTDYIHKACNKVLSYCSKHNIGTIVLGYNEGFKCESNLGRKNNQTFTQIPYYKIRKYFEYKMALLGIKLVIQEESYTSKASFWDKDYIPTLEEVKSAQVKPVFSGRRTKRGLYKPLNNKPLNADVNGALNILAKSKVVSLVGLYNRGVVGTPLRIRIA